MRGRLARLEPWLGRIVLGFATVIIRVTIPEIVVLTLSIVGIAGERDRLRAAR